MVVGYVRRQSWASSIDSSCRCKLFPLTMTIITSVYDLATTESRKAQRLECHMALEIEAP